MQRSETKGESQQPETLKELIEQEQDKISIQTANIKEAAAIAMKKSKLNQVQIVDKDSHLQTSKHNRFDKQVNQIGKQLASVAHQLQSLSKSTDDRINTLQGTLKEAGNWTKPKNNSPKKNKGGQNSPSSSQVSSKRGALQTIHDKLQDV